jgi:hypothetical protein
MKAKIPVMISTRMKGNQAKLKRLNTINGRNNKGSHFTGVSRLIFPLTYILIPVISTGIHLRVFGSWIPMGFQNIKKKKRTAIKAVDAMIPKTILIAVFFIGMRFKNKIIRISLIIYLKSTDFKSNCLTDEKNNLTKFLNTISSI